MAYFGIFSFSTRAFVFFCRRRFHRSIVRSVARVEEEEEEEKEEDFLASFFSIFFFENDDVRKRVHRRVR